jgi:hypothetical protein
VKIFLYKIAIKEITQIDFFSNSNKSFREEATKKNYVINLNFIIFMSVKKFRLRNLLR